MLQLEKNIIFKENKMYSAYIVDDDELIVDGIITSVPWMDNGFEVIGSCTDPLRAMEEIKELSPDVVFCDLKMPVLDGNALIAELIAQKQESEFVMISAYDSYENVRSFFLQNGFDYILKPVKSEDMQLVLEKLVKKLMKTKKTPEFTDEESAANPAFKKLIQYVNENYSKKLTLDSLSVSFNLGKNYICNLFAKHYSTTLTCYVTDLRMNAAKEMLINKQFLLKDIAWQCGYENYFHFFKVFKQYYGISPKEMRGDDI